MNHAVVSREEWLAARKKLLEQEKEHTHARDRLNAARRELPWLKVEKSYVFDAPQGRVTLADLFDGRSQLIVKHFMMGPGQKHQCVGCSFEVDQVQSALVHLLNHDVTYTVVARAPLVEIEALKKRMDWRFPWVSSYGSDFNYDFGVSFTAEQRANGTATYNFRPIQGLTIEDLSGHSVFYKSEAGEVFHTYSTFGRGAEEVLTAYMYLDFAPMGRNEPVRGNLTDWVRPHDRYGRRGHVEMTGRYVPED
jgi:predicted dithiol-disulfide oxidoreductase (DUF899 family)